MVGATAQTRIGKESFERMNLSWSRKILESLCAEGVEDFIFCAGARNSPMIVTLDSARGLRTYSFFEERSASFFALGLSRASGRPVAVITTSGTAAAELLPATIEAFHTGVPLASTARNGRSASD
jgi:2-succinyl-5-enolpyruvyl-6-hydroxy-3-cyclohexene-1-carboxylate synthase